MSAAQDPETSGAVAAAQWNAFAAQYDAWTADGSHDVAFYVDLARRSGGPVVELGVGSGRVAIPIARVGVRVIGIDFSREMLSHCARRARQESVASLIDLRLGDFTQSVVSEKVPLVICPLRS